MASNLGVRADFKVRRNSDFHIRQKDEKNPCAYARVLEIQREKAFSMNMG